MARTLNPRGHFEENTKELVSVGETIYSFFKRELYLDGTSIDVLYKYQYLVEAASPPKIFQPSCPTLSY